MSYDIRISVKVEGCDKYAQIATPEYNSPTYNLGDMFRACPDCDKQIKPNRDWTVEDRVVYLPVSFCPKCGIPIDWRGVLGEDELGELEKVQ